jgi:hypothetical protein
MLKYVILVGQRLRGEPTQPPRHHRLRDLWGEASGCCENARSGSLPMILTEQNTPSMS